MGSVFFVKRQGHLSRVSWSHKKFQWEPAQMTNAASLVSPSCTAAPQVASRACWAASVSSSLSELPAWPAGCPAHPRQPQLRAAWEMQLCRPLSNSGLKRHWTVCLEPELYDWGSKKCYRCQTNGKVDDSSPLPGCREKKARHFGSIWLSHPHNCCVQTQGCWE